MKAKIMILVGIALMLVGGAFAYIGVPMINPFVLDLAPGESGVATVDVKSDDTYNLSINCTIVKDDGTPEEITNGACGGSDEITVTFDDDSILIPGLSGDQTKGLKNALGSEAEEGVTYRYTVRAGNELSEGAVTADVNTIPEFKTIGAGIILVGAGIAYSRFRKK